MEGRREWRRSHRGWEDLLFWWRKRYISEKSLFYYSMALDGRYSTRTHTTTNQKQSAVMEGRRERRRDHWGGEDISWYHLEEVNEIKNNIKSLFLSLLLLLVVKIVAIAHNPPHPYPPWNGVTIYPPLSRPLFLVGCCVCRISISAIHWIIWCVVILIITQHNEKTSPIGSNPRAPSSSSNSSSPLSLSSLPHTYLIVMYIIIIIIIIIRWLCKSRNHSSHGFFSKPSAYDIAHDVWMKRLRAD